MNSCNDLVLYKMIDLYSSQVLTFNILEPTWSFPQKEFGYAIPEILMDKSHCLNVQHNINNNNDKSAQKSSFFVLFFVTVN